MFHVQNDYLAYDESERGLVPQITGVTKFHATRSNSQSLIVVHYTGSAGNLEQSVRAAQNPKARHTWHLTIGRDGNIQQLLSFDTIAYHTGKSVFHKHGKTWNNLNQFAIGIELENAGKMDRIPNNRFSRIIQGQERILDRSEVYYHVADDTWWESYTPVQYDRLIAISKTLVQHYGCVAITGHDQVSKSKIDPGPALDMDYIEREVFN